MRWRKETWQQKITRLKEWHDWYAWHPVNVGDDGQKVWLETVQRSCWVNDYGTWYKKYRLPPTWGGEENGN